MDFNQSQTSKKIHTCEQVAFIPNSFYFPPIFHKWKQNQSLNIYVFWHKICQLHDGMYMHLDASWRLIGIGVTEEFVSGTIKFAISRLEEI